MEICIIGTGYVGLVTGTCFAEKGNNVCCLDVDSARIAKLQQAQVPFHEPGLDDLVRKNFAAGRLRFTNSAAEALTHAQLCFVAVGTPMGENGSADLSQIRAAGIEIGNCLDHKCFIVVKSTVPVGTGDLLGDIVKHQMEARGLGNLAPEMVSNPEFLKEGKAIGDCLHPERVVVGVRSDDAKEIMTRLYEPFVNRDRMLFMDPASAEITKYAANAMLASRISFMNEIARLCDRVGADVDQIRRGMAADIRIGPHFLYAGCGYGGSCFPKDVRALCRVTENLGLDMPLVASVDEVNRRQKSLLPRMVRSRFGDDLHGLRVTVLGLAFKPDTDDMREAPSIPLIEDLVRRGARVKAFDPVARSTAAAALPAEVIYAEDPLEALLNADAAVLVTEWPVLQAIDWSAAGKIMKQRVLFDGRNIYDPAALRTLGFEYYCIGRGCTVPGEKS